VISKERHDCTPTAHRTVGATVRDGNVQYTGSQKTLSSAFLFYDLASVLR